MPPPLNRFEPKVRIADRAAVIRSAQGSEFTRLYLMRDFETLAKRYPREFVEETGGNLAAMARELFVEKTADDVVCLEGLKVHCRTIADDLAGSDPSPVLRLAVEAALFCYLEHWVLTENYARRPPTQENRDQARGAGRPHSIDTRSP